MARGVRPAVARNLAAHAHMAESVLERALERGGEFRDRQFGRVDGGSVAESWRGPLCSWHDDAKRRRFALLLGPAPGL